MNTGQSFFLRAPQFPAFSFSLVPLNLSFLPVFFFFGSMSSIPSPYRMISSAVFSFWISRFTSSFLPPQVPACFFLVTRDGTIVSRQTSENRPCPQRSPVLPSRGPPKNSLFLLSQCEAPLVQSRLPFPTQQAFSLRHALLSLPRTSFFNFR